MSITITREQFRELQNMFIENPKAAFFVLSSNDVNVSTYEPKNDGPTSEMSEEEAREMEDFLNSL